MLTYEKGQFPIMYVELTEQRYARMEVIDWVEETTMITLQEYASALAHLTLRQPQEHQ